MPQNALVKERLGATAAEGAQTLASLQLSEGNSLVNEGFLFQVFPQTEVSEAFRQLFRGAEVVICVFLAGGVVTGGLLPHHFRDFGFFTLALAGVFGFFVL
jgi:hypothetical protein